MQAIDLLKAFHLDLCKLAKHILEGFFLWKVILLLCHFFIVLKYFFDNKSNQKFGALVEKEQH